MIGEINKIQVGDIVSVSFNGIQFTLCHKATVLYIPNVGQGESWIFVDEDTKTIHYVSEGCTISKQQKENHE
jgi:hypothetical protein